MPFGTKPSVRQKTQVDAATTNVACGARGAVHSSVLEVVARVVEHGEERRERSRECIGRRRRQKAGASSPLDVGERPVADLS